MDGDSGSIAHSGEARICQVCEKRFNIEPEDFDFYKKIDVPAPTFCPDCRHRRRFCWRNERTLYKRKCNAPGHDEDVISTFAPEKPFVVYDDRYWWSDKWDPFDFGREYDFSKPFFAQYRELLERVPLIALSVTNMANCSYCNVAEGDKECYLISASERNERVMYSTRLAFSRDSMDLYMSDRNELGYELINCSQCYSTSFSRDSDQCTNSAFLYDCVGCNNCFGCAGLRKKSFYIFNEPYSKEDYTAKMKEYNLGNIKNIQKARDQFVQVLLKTPHRYAQILRSMNATGDNLVGAKNAKQCFDILGGAESSMEDAKYVVWGVKAKDIHDSGPGVGVVLETAYECFDSGVQSSRLFFTSVVYGSHDIFYSINCHASSYLFGCYGLRGKQYCILNRQYSKEEYEELLPRIKKQMMDIPYADSKGREYRFGEFFPAELSPFAYNETVAQEYFPTTKDKALEAGYLWRDPDQRNHQPTIAAADLPESIDDVPDSITNEVIACAHGGECDHQCPGAFRIIPQELAFYRNHRLALPRLCYNCRHYRRLEERNPMHLWIGKCQCAGAGSENGLYQNTIAHIHNAEHCQNTFETPYAPDRPEIIYCEQCYQSEMA